MQNPATTIEDERDALAYAVWMVGNTDTAEDKAAWWADFKAVWDLAAARVKAMHARGVVCGQGFAATGLKVGRADSADASRDNDVIAISDGFLPTSAQESAMSQQGNKSAPTPADQAKADQDHGVALATSSLIWWRDAQSMVEGSGWDERNIFDAFDPPAFIIEARRILAAHGIADPSIRQD